MKTRTLMLLAALAAAACGDPVVDVDKGELLGYEDWKRVDVWGEVGGHGDTYRIIYANDVAEDRYSNNNGDPGEWKPGAILIKEIRDRDGDEPGDLRYIGIMRRIVDGLEPDGAELHRINPLGSSGWLFTQLDGDIESDEVYRESCWSECHVSAPYGGAFLDYAR